MILIPVITAHSLNPGPFRHTWFQPAFTATVERQNQNASLHRVDSLDADLGQIKVRHPAVVVLAHP